MEALVLDVPAVIGTSVQPISVANIRPVVLFSILDHYTRRDASQTRVIGALLGSINGGAVEVTNCFGVQHAKREKEVLIQISAVNEVIALHKRVNEKEVVVGWYSTTGGDLDDESPIDDFTLVVHGFFSDFAPRPIHFLVDVSLAQPKISFSAYTIASNPSRLLTDVMVPFQLLKSRLSALPEERVALHAMIPRLPSAVAPAAGTATAAATAAASGPSAALATAAAVEADGVAVKAEIGAVSHTVRRLRKLLDTVLSYVDDVVAGKRAGDEGVGRAISEALASVPQFTPEAFEASFQGGVQDLLMVTYLSTLMQAQMRLAERVLGQVRAQ